MNANDNSSFYVEENFEETYKQAKMEIEARPQTKKTDSESYL